MQAMNTQHLPQRVAAVLHLVAILVVVLGFSAGVWPASAQGAPMADPVRVRIGVTTDGIVQIGPADLTAAGVDVSASDPRSFALSSLGQPVAIYVTGEADGVFDAADRLFFFGQRFRGPEMDQKYTDERVYWLDIGGPAGPRTATIGATPRGGLTPPQDFAATLHAEASQEWWTLHTTTSDSQDTWFWARLQPPFGAGKAITASLPYTVPDPAPGYPALLRLEQIARVDRWDIDPDHRAVIGLNGQQILDAGWDGMRMRNVLSATVPAGLLVSGVNTVTVAAWNQPGVSGDDVYANFWELDYRRLFRAWQGQLDFIAEASGLHEYEVAGWPSADVLIWDVSDPTQPIRLLVEQPLRLKYFLPWIGARSGGGSTGASSDPGGTIRFRANALAGTRYWLQAGTAVQPPASLRLRPPTGLRNPAGGADAVIVTPAGLRHAAERLANWHRAHGRRALVVDIQDVYDEFNEGIYHPKAVPALLKWAVQHWTGPAPAFLTLVGDGHWNFKGYNPAVYLPLPNPIPPYLAWVDPWQGEVPADALYGDLDGDMVPEVAVGRLAVNTLAEAEVVVDKIINYDETLRSAPWQRQAVFVSDNADSAGNFPLVSDEIIAGYLPADLQVQRIYLPSSAAADVTATRAAISQTLQTGAWMVQYTGHGAPERWAAENIWRNTDAAGLSNGTKLPVVMTFNCLDGYFAYPQTARFSVAEMMQRQAGGGSLAAISPSGLGLTTDQQNFRKILMRVIFTDHVRELGTALTQTRREYTKLYGSGYLVQTMTLFGDPALRLPAAAAP